MIDDHRKLLVASARVVESAEGTIGWTQEGLNRLSALLHLIRRQNGDSWPIDREGNEKA